MAYQLEYSFYSYTSSLNAKLYDSAGAQVGATITTGFVSLGSNQYSYLATIPDGHIGTLSIYDSANPTAAMVWSVNPQEAGSASLSTAVLQAIADQVLKRGASNVDGSADYNSLYALIQSAMNAVLDDDTGILTIYQTDGVTEFDVRDATFNEDGLPVASIQ